MEISVSLNKSWFLDDLLSKNSSNYAVILINNKNKWSTHLEYVSMGFFYYKNNYRFEQIQVANHFPKKPGFKEKDTKFYMNWI